MAFCNNCGKELTPNDRFCPECGVPQLGEMPAAPPAPAAPSAENPPVGYSPAAPAMGNPYPGYPPVPPPRKKNKVLLWVLIPVAILLLGGLATAAVLLLNPARQVIVVDDPAFSLDMEQILTSLCAQSDKVDGTNYAEDDSPYYDLWEITPLLTEYAAASESADQKNFVNSLLEVCKPLSKVTSKSGSKVSLKSLGFDIEKYLNLYRTSLGSLPEGIHYGPEAEISSSKSSSSKASSSKSSSSKASSSSSSKSSSPSATQTVANSRWDGDRPSSTGSDGLEQINGFSIVFQNGKAYFGTTYDTTADIISEGLEVTYTLSGSTIVFTNTDTDEKATCKYTNNTIVDTNGTMTTIDGYIFYRK